MQTAMTAKKHRKGFPTIKSNSCLQPTVKLDNTHDIPKDKVKDFLRLNPPTLAFNVKYKSDAAEYILSLRLEKGLDVMPKQDSVLASHTSLEHDSQFIYCLRMDQVKENVEFDPYTLVMVSPDKAKSFSVYCTASVWTITEVKC